MLGESAGPVVISAAIGPRGDAYSPDHIMTPEEAEAYHSEQIGTLVDTDADLVTALTLTHAAEAIGITRAARTAHMPVVISFTVETDGVLPDGSSLSAAILEVDAATDSAPVYYGVNCAHLTHFDEVLTPMSHWTERINMVRANASRMSHAELDDATEPDDGNPEEFRAPKWEAPRTVPPHQRLGRVLWDGCSSYPGNSTGMHLTSERNFGPGVVDPSPLPHAGRVLGSRFAGTV